MKRTPTEALRCLARAASSLEALDVQALFLLLSLWIQVSSIF